MIAVLDPEDLSRFPDTTLALREPNGLLAVGGDLSPARLEQAYRRGIFPWFTTNDPILWWSPDPRTLLLPQHLRISRSLRKRLRRDLLGVTFDRDFEGVIRGCSEPRATDGGGTWLVPAMIAAYRTLHAQGLAHSVEVWEGEVLVGGLYGIAIGRAFFGESMFSRKPDASKIALAHLCHALSAWNFELVDCQMRTEHLVSMGAIEMPREAFIRLLNQHCSQPGRPGSWDDGGEPRPTSACLSEPDSAGALAQ